MKHKKRTGRMTAPEAATARSRGNKLRGNPLNDGILGVNGDIRKIFLRLCKKHNSNMKAVWTELHAYLKREGKTKTVKALREAADRMSAMTVKDAIRMMEGMGLDTRNGIDLMVTVIIDGEKFAVRMPNPHSGKDTTLKNKDYATRVICTAIGVKGTGAFGYLQRQIGNKATKGLFRKATEEMTS